MKKTIYIYRGSLTGGGCTKIIRDLIILLHAQNKFNIVLISYVCSEFDVATDEDGNSIVGKKGELVCTQWNRSGL